MPVAIGIGVGIGLLALAIAGAVMYLSSRRRRKEKSELEARSSKTGSGSSGQEPDPILEFKAIRYGTSVEVRGAYESQSEMGPGQAVVPEQSLSSPASGSLAPDSGDRLWDDLYGEVSGRTVFR